MLLHREAQEHGNREEGLLRRCGGRGASKAGNVSIVSPVGAHPVNGVREFGQMEKLRI